MSKGEDSLKALQEALALPRDQQANKLWELCADVLKNDIAHRKCSKSGRSISRLETEVKPLLLEYAEALLDPKLPYEVRWVPGKNLGVYAKQAFTASYSELKGVGLWGVVEMLSTPFTAELAVNMGYNSVYAHRGVEGILSGPVSLLNEASPSVSSTLRFLAPRTSFDRSGAHPRCRINLKKAGASPSTKVKFAAGAEITVAYGSGFSRNYPRRP
jgi:hypothetical protein